MELFRSRKAPGCIERTCGIDDAELAQQPFSVGGTLYLPARHVQSGCINRDGLQSHISIMLGGGPTGLAINLTPDAARTLANCLNASADAADRSLAEHAAAAIEKARNL